MARSPKNPVETYTALDCERQFQGDTHSFRLTAIADIYRVSWLYLMGVSINQLSLKRQPKYLTADGVALWGIIIVSNINKYLSFCKTGGIPFPLTSRASIVTFVQVSDNGSCRSRSTPSFERHRQYCQDSLGSNQRSPN